MLSNLDSSDSASNRNSKHLAEYWGHRLSLTKSTATMRFVFEKINGFRLGNDPKTDNLFNFIINNKIDALMMAELNLNWNLVRKRQIIQEVAREYFERSRSNVSYNRYYHSNSTSQQGGTGIITNGDLSLRIIKTGEDDHWMGRWSWQLFRGKDLQRLRVISIYFPHQATEYGKRRTWSQQHRALLSKGDTRGVGEAWWQDFWKSIDCWLQQGDNIIIGGDWNCDVRDSAFLAPFLARGLEPAVTGRHGHSGPQTWVRGSKPIDEIFHSRGVQVLQCGYLSHGSSVGDHCPIWITLK